MALTFKQLSTAEGLAQVNTYLATRVYVFGLEPTTQDADLFKAFGSAPDAAKYPNAARYYSHISSFGDAKFAKLEGLTVAFGEAAAPKKAAKGLLDSDSDSDEEGGAKGLLDSDSDDDDYDAAAAARAARVKAEAAKHALKVKAKGKRKPCARSEIIFDIKPWSDEVDLEALGAKVKKTHPNDFLDEEAPGDWNEDGLTWKNLIEEAQKDLDERVNYTDGLHWGLNHQLEEVAFGVKKLRVQCIVQDDAIGSDLIIDMIQTRYKDEVQSVDVAAFQKV